MSGARSILLASALAAAPALAAPARLTLDEALAQAMRAQAAAARAGGAQARTTAAGLREAIALGFLRHFEARALERVAQSSLEELGQQQEVARARLASGVATEADVLRIQTAV